MLTPSPSIFVLGDSHSRYFRYAATLNLLGPGNVEVCEVGGATAAGLQNKQSFTAAAEKFREFLLEKPKKSIIVFHLGEVDCGILIWLRSAKHGTTLISETERSIASYFDFVDNILSLGFSDIVITGATMPTISDSDREGEVVNERRSKVFASQTERTLLTLRFNARLNEEALLRNLPFIDVSPRLLDAKTGVVKRECRNHNRADHHMDPHTAAVEWGAALANLLSTRTRSTKIRLIASSATFVKAIDKNSQNLKPQYKIMIKKGARLSGFLGWDLNKTKFLHEIEIENVSLAPRFRLIYSPHWTKIS